MRVLSDMPIFFDSDTCSFSVSDNSYRIRPYYSYSDDEYNYIRDECTNKLIYAVHQLVTEDNYTTALNLHDYICRNVVYSTDNDKMNHTWINPVLKSKGVCDGISKLFMIMCNLADIDCALIRGTAIGLNDSKPGPHAWNIILIEGKWYNIDVTFDLNFKFSDCNRDYFCASDEDICKDHYCTHPMNLCNDKSQYYHRKKGVTIVNREQLSSIAKIMSESYVDVLTFKIDGDWSPSTQDILDIFQKYHINWIPVNYNILYNNYLKTYTINCDKSTAFANPLPDLKNLFRGIFKND